MSYSDPKHFHEEIERSGLDAIEARLPQYGEKDRAVGEIVIAQYRRDILAKQHNKELEEQISRDERAIDIADKTLTEQKNGNETQTKIFWVLVATLMLTLLVAIFKD